MSQEWSADAGQNSLSSPSRRSFENEKRSKIAELVAKCSYELKKHCSSLEGSELSNDKLETIVKTKALLCKLNGNWKHHLSPWNPSRAALRVYGMTKTKNKKKPDPNSHPQSCCGIWTWQKNGRDEPTRRASIGTVLEKRPWTRVRAELGEGRWQVYATTWNAGGWWGAAVQRRGLSSGLRDDLGGGRPPREGK